MCLVLLSAVAWMNEWVNEWMNGWILCHKSRDIWHMWVVAHCVIRWSRSFSFDCVIKPECSNAIKITRRESGLCFEVVFNHCEQKQNRKISQDIIVGYYFTLWAFIFLLVFISNRDCDLGIISLYKHWQRKS